MVSNATVIIITVCVSFLGAFAGAIYAVVSVLGTRISDVRQDVRDLQRDIRDFKSEIASALAKFNGH